MLRSPFGWRGTPLPDEKREVRIGSRSPGSVEIVQGLRVGERIVVEGTVKLRDSGPVRDLAKDLGGPAQGAGQRP